ncbi:MAG TPA: hypothetical protein VIR29_01655 [Anseongella sp.]
MKSSTDADSSGTENPASRLKYATTDCRTMLSSSIIPSLIMVLR